MLLDRGGVPLTSALLSLLGGPGLVLGVWTAAVAALGLTLTAPRPINPNQGLVMGLVLAGATLLVREPVFPPWPPVGAMGRLPYVVVVTALIAFVAVHLRAERLAIPFALLAPPVLGVGVVALPEAAQTLALVQGGGFVLLTLVLAQRLLADRGADGALPLGLVATSAGLVALAGLYPSVLSVHAAGVLATTLAIWVGAGLRGERFGIAPAIVGQVAVAGIGATLAISAPALAAPIALVLMMPLARWPASLLVKGARPRAAVQSVLMVGLGVLAVHLARTLP
ncbi:hypothetical protein EV659_107118 [Rhodothalassium salexigens DSM 2132]|uniref:Uncharacterized protein n=1 Tax=Rhodothalassium salexigens DSM 2132 TaxID=1188247 RepID=A0A4R2PG60_RHOSA|nr:hypothetical protein [Rhodothalassium salexigens DSM 2132]TCP33508.1 hypothetical protein EV659_107118 [Rhodothalassium salexigens DSM 2132]